MHVPGLGKYGAISLGVALALLGWLTPQAGAQVSNADVTVTVVEGFQRFARNVTASATPTIWNLRGTIPNGSISIMLLPLTVAPGVATMTIFQDFTGQASAPAGLLNSGSVACYNFQNAGGLNDFSPFVSGVLGGITISSAPEFVVCPVVSGSNVRFSLAVAGGTQRYDLFIGVSRFPQAMPYTVGPGPSNVSGSTPAPVVVTNFAGSATAPVDVNGIGLSNSSTNAAIDDDPSSSAGSLLINGGGTRIQEVFLKSFDGSTFDKNRSASLTNFPTSVTLTARNSIGAVLAEKGSRWSVTATAATGSQSSASIASEASVRHVVDCITFSAASTTAPALTLLGVSLRDGASGAGTVIWSHIVAIPAATGQNVVPHSVCGLNLVGTTATAMTFEFQAGLANLQESVSISGYNIN
jgi:hypothetical protein